MKTHAIEWNTVSGKSPAGIFSPTGSLNNSLQFATKAFLALVPALAIVVGSSWLIAMPDLVIYLQATLWASGFIFFGLAIDSETPANGLSLLTGLALPLLALMSSRVAVEIVIIPATLVALWVATLIWRRQV